MVELVGAAGGQAAVQPERWAEAGAQQRQLRVWPGRQVLEEEDREAGVLKGQDRWEEDPGADRVVWSGRGARVAVLRGGCLESAAEPQDEPREWVWEPLGETGVEGETVEAC